LIALGNPKAAYTQLMELRDKYPRSDSDAEARALVHSILASNPEVADTGSLTYHRGEAALLLREGQLADANAQARAGLAMAPEPLARAELLWISARALKPSEPDRARRAILVYLNIAPRGRDAPAALEALALIYWHDNDYFPAREALILLSDQPNAEVALDVEVMANDQSLFKDEHFFYIDGSDIPLYRGSFNTPKPAVLQTGPVAAAPMPARVMRVTTQ